MLRYEPFAFRVSAGDLAGSRGESDQAQVTLEVPLLLEQNAVTLL